LIEIRERYTRASRLCLGQIGHLPEDKPRLQLIAVHDAEALNV
jgi:hypothetical protein